MSPFVVLRIRALAPAPWQWIAILIFFVFPLACAKETQDHNPCAPPRDPLAETHLSTVKNNEGNCSMLHLVGKSCPQVGENLFHLYAVDCQVYGLAPGIFPVHEGEGGGTMEPHLEPVTVVSVTGTHLDMGHGLPETPAILPDHPDQFRVRFSMAGRWELTITYKEAATAPAMTSSHTLEVLP